MSSPKEESTAPNPNDPSHPIHPHYPRPAEDHNPEYRHQDLLNPEDRTPFTFEQDETENVPNPNAPSQPLHFDRFGHHGHITSPDQHFAPALLGIPNPLGDEGTKMLSGSRENVMTEPESLALGEKDSQRVQEEASGSGSGEGSGKGKHSRKPTGQSITFDMSTTPPLDAPKRPGHSKHGSSAGGSKSGSMSHFDLAHRRPSRPTRTNTSSSSESSVSSVTDAGHIITHEMPLKWAHLWKKPVVRQWLYQGKLYYEPTDRGMSKFELFFDLAFVGVIHQLAEAAAESATGLNVAKFLLVFYPAWSVWSDARNFINISGTDDVVQRAYILGIMILLIGYSSNASGIRFVEAEEAEGAATTEAGGGAVERAVEAVGHFVSYLFRRQEEGGTESQPTAGTGEGTTAEGEAHVSPYTLTEDSHFAIAATAGYLIAAKFIRLGFYLYYSWALPNFRYIHLFNGLTLFLVTSLYIPLVVHGLPTGWVIGLTSAAIISELSLRYVVGIGMEKIRKGWTKGHEEWLNEKDMGEKGGKRRVFHNTRGRTADWFEFYPALNLAHFIERMAAFVVLVLGETIINITYIASANQIGPHSEFQRSACGLILAFMLAWLYFDADSSRVFIHALRRNVFTSISYGHLHFPFCAALILISAAMVRLVQSTEAPDGIRWYFGGGVATALTLIALMGWLHRDLDKHGSSLVPRNIRLLLRGGVAVFFALIPLVNSSDLDNSELLGISAGVLTALVLIEMAGKIGAVGDLEKQRLVHQGKLDPRHRDHEDEEDDFVELTEAERGEDDVGVEGDLGEIEMKRVTRKQAKAYASW